MEDSTLEKVVNIDIADCQNCLLLPKLGKLRHLKFLRLENLAVEYIIEDVKDGSPVTIQFPSLESLQLCSLPHLKGVLKEQVSTKVFPKLVHLKIDSCSSLILPELSSLENLDVQNWSSLMLSSFSKLDTLTYLKLGFGENMKCVPIETLEKLTNLNSLRIVGAEEISLPEEGMRALTSLTELWIEGSGTLTCLPQGWLRHLASLRQVTIDGCPEFVELPEEIKYLKYLKSVNLDDAPKVVCVSKALSSFKRLFLQTLPKLNSLPDWLDHLTSLQRLLISYCPKLVSLPASIRGMPNLQYLTIRGCPELERRCERGTGEDWHKIAHIPHLHTGDYCVI